MDKLEVIGERIRLEWTKKSAARDLGLQHSRMLIRYCSRAIRAAHRSEFDKAQEELDGARSEYDGMVGALGPYPDLASAGYSRDALKEFAEAHITIALIRNEPLPEPEDLGVPFNAYLGGLGEAASEMRRRILDILRHDEIDEAERLLEKMDEIYGILVTFDFPDAITGGLRRTNDLVRGVTERTRGDLTTSLQQRALRIALKSVEDKLDQQPQ